MMFNEVPSAAIGLEWEPCHHIGSFVDPIPQLKKWLPKIIHVHGKDAMIDWNIVREAGIRGGNQYTWNRHPGFGAHGDDGAHHDQDPTDAHGRGRARTGVIR